MEINQIKHLNITNNTEFDYNKYAYDISQNKLRKRYFGIDYNNNKRIKKNKNKIEIKGNKYIPSNKDCSILDEEGSSMNIMEDAYVSISCKCNKLMSEKIPTIINKSSINYQKYKKSDLYKKSSENTKDVNSYLWYYATNRIQQNTDVNDKNNDKIFKKEALVNLKKNGKIKKQLDYLTANILSNNFVVLDDLKDTKNLNLSISIVFRKIFRIISFIFLIFTTISFLITIYKFCNFGDTQVNLFYDVGKNKYAYGNIIFYFVLILAIGIGLNSNAIYSALDNLFETNKINNKNYILKSSDKKCVNNVNDTNIKETFVSSNNFRINKTNCVIDENKELKCDCDSKTQKECDRTAFGCCDNSHIPKINKDGVNCKNIKSNGGFIFLSIVILIIFSLSYFVLNLTNRKWLSIITYILCIVLILFIYLISFNYIELVQNGIDVIKSPTLNTCYNVVMYYNKKFNTDQTGILGSYFGMFVALIVSGCLYILFKYFTFYKSVPKIGIGFGSLQNIFGLLVIFLTVLCIFFMFIIAYSMPIIYFIILVVFRFFSILLSKLLFMIYGYNGNAKINNNIDKEQHYIFSILASIYSVRIEYIKTIFKNTFFREFSKKSINHLEPLFTIEHLQNYILKLKQDSLVKDYNLINSRHILENLELPTGMPWNYPLLNIFKIITTCIYTGLYFMNKPEDIDLSKITVQNNIKNQILNNLKDENYLLRFGMNYIPTDLNKKKILSTSFSANSQIFTSPFNIIILILDLFGF